MPALFLVVLVPLVGWLVWSRLPAGHGEEEDYLETAFASVLCGVIITGLSALLLAEIGDLSQGFLLACLAITTAVLWRIPRRLPSGPRPRAMDVAAVLLLTTFAIATVAPGSEDILGGRDPGVYSNTGSWVAREGTLRVHAEGLRLVDEPAVPAFHRGRVFIPALHVLDATRGEVVPQFFHLHPVYMALGFWIGGAAVAFLVPPFFGVMAELAVFFFARRLLGTIPAVIAASLLAVNLAQIWGVRNPYSEGATQLGVFAALWAVSRGQCTGGFRWGILAAASVGLCLLLRIDAALLLAALVPPLALVHGNSVGQQRWISHAFIPLTLLFGAWAAAHGWFVSYPYVKGLWGQLWPLWSTTLAVIVLAAAAFATRHSTRWIVDWIQRNGRWLWPSAAAALSLAFLLGMWVRPHLEPFEMFRGGRLRRYNEETLLRMGWYVSVQGMVAATAGAVLLMRDWLLRRRLNAVPFLAVFLAFSLLYFWNQRIHPDHPWAMRRFLPVVLPGICVSIAVFVSRLWALHGPWRVAGRAAAAVVVGSIAVHEAAMARPFWSHREYAGILDQIGKFAHEIPADSIVLFGDRGTEQRIAMPLALHWERLVVPVTRARDRDWDGEERRESFERQVIAWLDEGRVVLYLTAGGGNFVYLTREIRWEPFTTLHVAAPTIGSRYDDAPRSPRMYRESFHVVRAVRAATAPLPPCAPLTLRVGGPLLGTGQGLFAAEHRGRYRWAMPDSRVLLPSCDRTGAGRPHALRVHAACGPTNPAGRCRVDVEINGSRAGTLDLVPRFADYDVPIPDDTVADATGGIDIRFHGALDPSTSHRTVQRSFLLGRITLTGAPGTEQSSVRHLFRPEVRPPDLNLMSDTAVVVWDVQRRGFYNVERDSVGAFRWTDGHGSLAVRMEGSRPTAVRLKLARSSRPDRPIRITANGCFLFEGVMPQREWEATLPIRECAIEVDELVVVIDSDVVRPARDTRTLGVAVRHVGIE